MIDQANSNPSAHRRPTILLVDDSRESLEPLARLLKLSGYHVRVACTATEAIAQTAAGPIDLIISDLGLPDRAGTELMREVRATRYFPGIALTGHTGEDVVRDCKSAGFDRHFAKPIAFEDLTAAISELLHRDAPVA